MTKLKTHCGCCSQCLDRRFAVLAADAGEQDPVEMYKVELLTEERNEDEDKTMAESYVRTALEVREMGELAFFGRFSGQTARVCDGFPSVKADEIGRQVFDLHQRHAQAIEGVLKAAVERHSAALVKGSLPSSSVLMMTVSRGRTPALVSIGKRADPIKAWLEEEPESTSADTGGRYVPDWERLPDAVKRVMTTGVKEVDAKLDLCRAISDRKIKVRFRVEREQGSGSIDEAATGTVRYGSDVDIPTHLKSSDFDWQRSRPLKPWRYMRRGYNMPTALWHLEWIEVLRNDVTAVFCGGEGTNNDAARKVPATAGHETKAIKALASQLRANAHLTRTAAAEWCRKSGYKVGKRAFERVWPEAREAAGLARIGSPGRKRKSPP